MRLKTALFSPVKSHESISVCSGGGKKNLSILSSYFERILGSVSFWLLSALLVLALKQVRRVENGSVSINTKCTHITYLHMPISL